MVVCSGLIIVSPGALEEIWARPQVQGKVFCQAVPLRAA